MLEISPQVFKLPTTEVVYSDDTKSVKQARRLRQQQRHKFCISDNEKRAFFNLGLLRNVLVLFTLEMVAVVWTT